MPIYTYSRADNKFFDLGKEIVKHAGAVKPGKFSLSFPVNVDLEVIATKTRSDMMVTVQLAQALAHAEQSRQDATPFNGHNSTQAFQKNQSGGIQQVVAKDPNDKALVTAIRSYLEAEAERFGKGDYSGPFKSLRYLKAVKPGQIGIVYRNVQAGAAIDYVGADAAAVDAIHKWLDAEISNQE